MQPRKDLSGPLKPNPTRRVVGEAAIGAVAGTEATAAPLRKNARVSGVFTIATCCHLPGVSCTGRVATHWFAPAP